MVGARIRIVGRIGGMLRYAGWLHAQGVGRMLCAAYDDRRQYRSPTIERCWTGVHHCVCRRSKVGLADLAWCFRFRALLNDYE